MELPWIIYLVPGCRVLVNRNAVIKKQTGNSRLNSYNNSKWVIKINYRRYYKVVTKLLQRANISTPV